MKHLKTYRLFESEWKSVEELLAPLIQNARKWKLADFIEEYVDRYDIVLPDYMNNSINAGDQVKMEFRNAPELDKTVTAEKDWGSNGWRFILAHTDDIQEQAKKDWAANRNQSKPKFKKDKNTITAYHASPKKFKQFEYQDKKESGQVGADTGFFFFLDRKNAEHYARVHADNYGKGYLYTVEVNPGEHEEWKGENVGTNWGRQGDLAQAEIEGMDSIIIRDADTGYGITDELIVFDDDNIKIVNVEEF